MEVSIATCTSTEAIADMDSLSFLALAEVVSRVSNRQKYESAWTAMIAAQGTKEGMEKLTKPWKKTKPKSGDDFIRALKLPGRGTI